MATFAELKHLSENMEQLNEVSWALNQYDIDSFAEHLPPDVRRANDLFTEANKHVPGWLDYNDMGFTEPEDERDCFANNLAIVRLPELIPYLEQANKNLDAKDIESDSYSMHALHLGAEILKAKDARFTKEQMDYLCDEAFKHDFPYFGCKHYEYDTCDARARFMNGMSVDKVREYQNMNPNVKQAVDFYTDHCEAHDKPVDDKAVSLIASAHTMDEAYGLYEHLVYDNNQITVEQGEEIHKAIGQIIDASKDEKYNPKVTMTYPDGDTYELDRLSSRYSEGYVDSMAEMINKNRRLAEHPERLQNLTKDFIEKGGAERWISSYFEQNPESFKESLGATPCGGDNKNYYMFYTGGGGDYSNNTVEAIAKFGQEHFPNFKDLGFEDIKNFHVYWGTDESRGYESFYNGDTYVLFDDIEKLPEDMKKDALNHCDGYKKQKFETKEPTIDRELTDAIVQNGLKPKKSPVYINSVNAKIIGEDSSKSFYSVSVSVDKSMSESGYVNINCDVSDVHKSKSGKSYNVSFSNDHERNAKVVKDGKKETVRLKVSDIAKSHESTFSKRKLPPQPESDNNEYQDDISK